MSRLEIRTIESLPFQENTYVVWLTGRTDCLVIDPGLEPDLIFEVLQENGLKPAAILNTHGHGDHIGGNEALKKAYPDAPLIIGENEKHLLRDPRANVSGLFGIPIISPPADWTLQDGDRITYAGITFLSREIPGHSPGHVVFIHEGERTTAFVGDVLFRGSVGRTDFPGGSFETLEEGIRAKLFVLPEDTAVYPGHGPATTIGHERRTNPFVKDAN
ncbi:MAG: MBL fold metallo-hydrolase [Gemmataceae bacterium]|nr:MBL fold metallo-hydrolase [Gemmataceae bacterium]